MATKGDIAVAADGRSLDWLVDDPGPEFVQRTQAAAAFTAGTYRYDRYQGFPHVRFLSQLQSADELTGVIKYFLLGRPKVAEVVGVSATREGTTRTWRVRAQVRLQGGTTTALELLPQ